MGDFLSFLCCEGVSEIGEVPKTIEKVERVKGIEPSSLAWEAKALPLSYTRHPIATYRPWPLLVQAVVKREIMRIWQQFIRGYS